MLSTYIALLWSLSETKAVMERRTSSICFVIICSLILFTANEGLVTKVRKVSTQNISAGRINNLQDYFSLDFYWWKCICHRNPQIILLPVSHNSHKGCRIWGIESFSVGYFEGVSNLIYRSWTNLWKYFVCLFERTL